MHRRAYNHSDSSKAGHLYHAVKASQVQFSCLSTLPEQLNDHRKVEKGSQSAVRHRKVSYISKASAYLRSCKLHYSVSFSICMPKLLQILASENRKGLV